MLYITALRSLERLDIQFVPKSINTSRKVTLGEIAVVGRNNPFQHYTGGGNTFSLELDFCAEEESREDVVRKCRLLESWAMNDGFEFAPERLRITFGKFFKENEVWVISNINVDYSMFSAQHGMLPTQAYAKVDFVLDTSTNRKKSDVQWS